MKNIKLITLFVVFTLVVSVFFVSCKKPIRNSEDTSSNQPVQDLDFVPSYEIVTESNKLRFDESVTYFILIDPIDLSSEAFVGQIKNIIKQVVIEKLKKENISILIFDNREALEVASKNINSDDQLLQSHFIAKYIGESDSETYKDTLYIFPLTSKDNIEIGKYYDIIEFNPYNW